LAAQERALSVDDAVRLGLERNALVQAAGADAAAARAASAQVRAGRLPALRAQGTATRLSNNIPPVTFALPGLDSTLTFQAVELRRYDAEVSVEQPIFTGFRLSNRIRSADEQARAAAYDAQQTKADVALEIRRAFWTLQRAEAVRASVQAAVGHVDEYLADVRKRLAEGSALRRDLLAAETRRSEVALERVQAENAVRVGQLELNRLIGLPLETPVRPTGDVAVETTPATPEPPAADVLAGRPRLNALAAQVQALRAEVRAAQGAALPELSLVGRYSYARPNPYFFAEQNRFHYSWELGVSARWNIWEGGRAGAATAEARERLSAAEARLADTREQATVEVARQRLEVDRAAQAVEAAGQNVAAAEESFRITRQQYDEGAALASDVLDAEEAFRRAEARRAGALADYAIARATLLNALGRVW
ncbi:MAG TPA: TolC family protein, partial [Longimicrobiales bacterium]